MARTHILRKGYSRVSDLADGGLAGSGLLGTAGNVYYVDPTNGNNGNDGTSPDNAKASLLNAYNLTTGGQNDVVVFIGGATADSPTASLTWSKTYTHLIGISADLPGMGQRCRVVGSAASDLTPIVTFSGDGCIVRNIQFFNGKDADSDSGAVIITADRCEFSNVFFAGMGHATPAARAGSYSVTMNGAHENAFYGCTFGLDTVVRAAANAELIMTGGSARNSFYNCKFISNSATAGKGLISYVTNADSRWNDFVDCFFFNYSTNWGTQIDNVFLLSGANATHYISVRGAGTQVLGPVGLGDTITHIYSALPAPNAGWGLATTPTT